MNTVFAKLLPATGALVVLVSGALLMPAPSVQGAPQTSDVRVVNTTAQPVPTLATGTTAVAGEVTIGGIPAVTVVNGPRSPIPVHLPDPAIEAYQVNEVVQISAYALNTFHLGAIVPAGKRFVIEYVSARAEVPSGGTLLEAGIQTYLNGNWGFYHYLIPTFTGGTYQAGLGNNIFLMSHPIRTYADGNTALKFTVRRNDKGVGTPVSIFFTVTGYLIDLQ